LDDDLTQISAFILEVDRLKGVLRKTKPSAIGRYENSAEHSWQVALLALLLASHASQPVDIQRVVEILLVHDIPEIEIGDVIVYAQPDPERGPAEAHAARDIFGLLPEPQAAVCLARWEEYERRDTPESRFAYAVDRLMPLLHNLDSGGAGWRENRIPLDRVLDVNSAIGDALPSVWQQVRSRIMAHAEAGGFEGI
jgi:putative hydrolase of HD superfamily